jgi:hypothetical protein
MRRIVYLHTAGPWIGLRQILGGEFREGQSPGSLVYFHTGETKALAAGPLPDRLAPVQMAPDGRVSKGMRLKTTDKYVLYVERNEEDTDAD